MFNEPFLALLTSQEAQVHPHGLLNSRVTDMHEKRIRQIHRVIVPPGKWWSAIFGVPRPQTNTERRSTSLSPGPPLPKQGAPCTLTLSLPRVAHPKQFNHGVGKGKTSTGGTLSEMLIWRTLMQT